jgi:DNA-binding response OmpR family regulator
MERKMAAVLIIEDDLQIADILEEVLRDDGFDVCGIARTVEDALTLAGQHHPQLAIVDLYLAHGGLGSSIAPVLMTQYNTGILYTTANVHALATAPGHASLRKPFRLHDVSVALGIVARIVETGFAIPPFPPNFEVLSTEQDD